jgi:hypothetical protein
VTGGRDDRAYEPRHREGGHAPRHRRERFAAWPRLAVAAVLVAAAATVSVVRLGSGGPPTQTAAAHGDPAAAGEGAAAAGAEGSGAGGPGAGSTGGAGGAPPVERPDRPDGAPAFVVPAPSPPVRVEIPAIGVDSDLVDLGLEPDGAMEAPADYDRAGWFTPGPEPGQPGPAVIAGHVDSQAGPAVFHRLRDLAPGDEVRVHRQDGSVVTFTVTGRRRYPKDAFPTDAVYGPVPGPELRLITCGGDFDRAEREYQDNVVVYATGPTM